MRLYRKELEDLYDSLARIDFSGLTPDEAAREYYKLFPLALPAGWHICNELQTLYRANWISSRDSGRLSKCDGFSAPSAERAKRNRLNIDRFPVFYAAKNWTTAVREIAEQEHEGQQLYVSKWSFTGLEPFGVCCVMPRLGLNEIADAYRQDLERGMQDFAEKNCPTDPDALRFLNEVFSRMLLRDNGSYPLTAWFGNQLLYNSINGPKLIMYPSYAHAERSICFALHPALVQKGELVLDAVVELDLRYLDVDDDGVELEAVGMRCATILGDEVRWP